jgi:hypothetical protein
MDDGLLFFTITKFDDGQKQRWQNTQKTPLSIWLVSSQVPHRNPMDHKHVKISFFTSGVGKDSNM